jgi:hypothetical protein
MRGRASRDAHGRLMNDCSLFRDTSSALPEPVRAPTHRPERASRENHPLRTSRGGRARRTVRRHGRDDTRATRRAMAADLDLGRSLRDHRREDRAAALHGPRGAEARQTADHRPLQVVARGHLRGSPVGRVRSPHADPLDAVGAARPADAACNPVQRGVRGPRGHGSPPGHRGDRDGSRQGGVGAHQAPGARRPADAADAPRRSRSGRQARADGRAHGHRHGTGWRWP